MSRSKDATWNVHAHGEPGFGYPSIHADLLMDLRDELKKLNRVFECPNFVKIPRVLDRISANTAKRKKRPKLKPRRRRV